jgi:sialate O-acetylesterase
VINRRRPFLFAIASACFLAASARAQSPLTLAPLFGEHGVVQRDVPVKVWGTATAKEDVTVTFAGRATTARADASGRWMATLPAVSAGGPYVLDVRATSGAALSVPDMLVGDVYVCSGQSNMELAVAQSAGGGFVASRSANDQIRLISIGHAGRPAPAAAFDAPATWQPADARSVSPFSAACYFMGRDLQEHLRVPIGLVHASWGGSAIEPWIGEAGVLTLGGDYATKIDLLHQFATDEIAANQRFGAMWEAWWRAHGAAAGEPWRPEDNGPWTDVPGLRNWKTWAVPELATHDGMVWYRRSFTLTAAQAAGAATLALGGIDEVDETWVNGRVIRNTFGWGTPRTYALPAGALRAGDNVLVVNVLSTWDAGGMLGPADTIAMTLSDGTKIPLGDQWRYRAVPLAMGRPPRAPWETISGLTTMYNAMIAPIGPYGLRGAAWYQGETNADAAAGYNRLLAALMTSWRAQFGADLPFLIVQLPNFGAVPTKPTEANWANLRDEQRRAVAADPHAALVVTIDIGEPGELHPANKRDVGARLARAARHVIYGEAITPSGPIAVGAHRDGSSVTVTFKDIDGALATYSAGVAIGFELCGSGAGSCQYAAGTVDGAVVALPVPASFTSPPSRVRFCWGASPVCNLSDASGLPAGPFELPIN